MFKRLVISIICVCALSVPALSDEPESPDSGFLGDYSKLESFPELVGVKFETSADEGFLRYQKIMISEVTVNIHPDVQQFPLTEEQIYELADHFKAEITEQVSPNYQIVMAPGDDVLVMRLAVTNIVPNDLYFNLSWDQSRPGFGINYATIEIDFNLATTGKRILALVDERNSQRFEYFRGYRSWLHTDDLIEQIDELLTHIVESQYAEFQ